MIVALECISIVRCVRGVWVRVWVCDDFFAGSKTLKTTHDACGVRWWWVSGGFRSFDSFIILLWVAGQRVEAQRDRVRMFGVVCVMT